MIAGNIGYIYDKLSKHDGKKIKFECEPLCMCGNYLYIDKGIETTIGGVLLCDVQYPFRINGITYVNQNYQYNCEVQLYKRGMEDGFDEYHRPYILIDNKRVKLDNDSYIVYTNWLPTNVLDGDEFAIMLNNINKLHQLVG